jgi:hypothetical protein
MAHVVHVPLDTVPILLCPMWLHEFEYDLNYSLRCDVVHVIHIRSAALHEPIYTKLSTQL